jgi:hypothetical protein
VIKKLREGYIPPFFDSSVLKLILLNGPVVTPLEYDHEFGKGDDMFRDLTLSRDLTADFHREKGPRNLSVMVLQHSAWPVYKRVSFDLPTSVCPFLSFIH